MKINKGMPNKPKEGKKIEVIREWRKGWDNPNVYILNKDGSIFYFREHTSGKFPFVKFEPK